MYRLVGYPPQNLGINTEDCCFLDVRSALNQFSLLSRSFAQTFHCALTFQNGRPVDPNPTDYELIKCDDQSVRSILTALFVRSDVSSPPFLSARRERALKLVVSVVYLSSHSSTSNSTHLPYPPTNQPSVSFAFARYALSVPPRLRPGL